jgi:hypothetical protein
MEQINTLRQYAEFQNKTNLRSLNEHFAFGFPTYADKELGNLPRKLREEMGYRAEAWHRWNRFEVVPAVMEKCGTEDPWVAQDLAVALDNQRLINESLTDYGDVAQFKRVTIPMVSRTIAANQLTLGQLCNHWMLLKPEGHVYWQDGDRIRPGKKVKAVTRMYETYWRYEHQQDLRTQHNSEREKELMQRYADALQDEIVMEAVNTMWATAAFSSICHKNCMMNYVENSRHSIFREIGREANWIYTSPALAQSLGFEVFENHGTTDHGNLKLNGSPIRVFSNPKMRRHGLLMGYKGGGFFDGGFCYVDYVPFTQAPVVLDPVNFEPIKRMMRRGAKALRPGNGAAYYAKLRVKGV